MGLFKIKGVYSTENKSIKFFAQSVDSTYSKRMDRIGKELRFSEERTAKEVVDLVETISNAMLNDRSIRAMGFIPNTGQNYEVKLLKAQLELEKRKKTITIKGLTGEDIAEILPEHRELFENLISNGLSKISRKRNKKWWEFWK